MKNIASILFLLLFFPVVVFGAPGGADTSVQFNDGGNFGGDANFTWHATLQQLWLAGNLLFGSGDRTINVDVATTTNVTGGSLAVFSADATGDGDGGALSLSSGASDTNGDGGTVNILSGSGGSESGNGGYIQMLAGDSTDENASGGSIWLLAGNNHSGGSAGEFRMRAGDAAEGNGSGVRGYAGTPSGGGKIGIYGGDAATGNLPGGNVTLTPGVGSGSGENGHIEMISAGATTTVDIGDILYSGSHACFNTKNTAGDTISFYFVGTSMVVENNACK